MSRWKSGDERGKERALLIRTLKISKSQDVSQNFEHSKSTESRNESGGVEPHWTRLDR